jgi:hypothetical protein
MISPKDVPHLSTWEARCSGWILPVGVACSSPRRWGSPAFAPASSAACAANELPPDMLSGIVAVTHGARDRHSGETIGQIRAHIMSVAAVVEADMTDLLAEQGT